MVAHTFSFHYRFCSLKLNYSQSTVIVNKYMTAQNTRHRNLCDSNVVTTTIADRAVAMCCYSQASLPSKLLRAMPKACRAHSG